MNKLNKLITKIPTVLIMVAVVFVSFSQALVLDSYAASTPTITLTASPTSITSGGSSRLTWSSANTTSCKWIRGLYRDSTLLSGWVDVWPATTTTYTIECTGSGWTISRSVTVTIATTSTPTITLASASSFPTTITSAATSITQTSATLSGQVNPNGAATEFWFEHGVAGQSLAMTSMFSAGSGTSDVPLSRTISNLQPSTTYNFRIVARNSAGTAHGNIRTFTTPATVTPPPSVTFPTTITSAATSITQTSATLSGQVNPNGAATEYWFEYGTTSFTHQTVFISAGSGHNLINISQPISGLTANTRYIFRLVARNSVDTRHGSTHNFTTSDTGNIDPVVSGANAPRVVISPAHGITNTSVLFSGFVHPGGAWTEYWFEYGVRDGGFHQRSDTWSVSDRLGNTPVTASAYNLSPGTTYYYRLVAQNSNGFTRSITRVFTTDGGRNDRVRPAARTMNATNVSLNTATLNAEITAHNSQTEVWFEYGLAGQGLHRVSERSTIEASDRMRNIAINIRNLTPNTRYEFRVVARNADGITHGTIIGFTTIRTGVAQIGAPEIITTQATNITPNTVIFRSRVDSGDSAATLWFEYGTSAFDLRWKSTNILVPHHTTPRDYSAFITGLTPNTIYFYRAIARNAQGETRGDIKFFQTTGGADMPVVRPPVTRPPVTQIEQEVIMDNITHIFLDPSVSNLEPRVGDTINYVLTYRNASNQNITNSSLNVSLPFGVEFVDSTVRPASQIGNNLVFTIGNIGRGAEGTVTIQAKVAEDVAHESKLMFNAFLEYVDAEKEPQTVHSSISITVQGAQNIAFLASLNAVAQSIFGSWFFLLLFIIMLIAIIYLIATRRREYIVATKS